MQVGWIDALRRYNAGMPSWCIPRKGTPGYDMVMKIRRGDETQTPKQIMDFFERKTTGRAKKEKRTATISLEEKPTEMQSVDVPTIPVEKSVEKKQHKMKEKTDRVAEGGKMSMDNLYYHKEKFDYTIWKLDGDTFTQLADWNSVKKGSIDWTDDKKGGYVPAGFVKTMARKRKTDDKGQSYLTPKDKKNVFVYPLKTLPASPSRLQTEVVEGLKELGYKQDIKFDDVASKEDIAKEEAYKEMPAETKEEAKKRKQEEEKEARKRTAEHNARVKAELKAKKNSA